MSQYLRIFCILLLPGLPAAAWADYSVGRLSDLGGAVSVQTPGEPESHYATRNEVLAEGDQLATGSDGTAELQFGNALIEVGPGSVAVLTRVTTDGLGLYLAQGSVAAARLGGDGSPTILLQGPRSANYLDTSGQYRFDVWPDSQDETLAVRLGRAISDFDQRSISLYAGQAVALSGGGIGEGMTLVNAPQPDGLDDLLEDRLHGLRGSPLLRRLHGDWIGAAALDDQGEWLEVSSAGPLWVPFFLPADWAPYRYGRWQWNGVWGWTWIDDLPWAYAPYHYGRWIRWNNRWAWSPQGRVPVFSPRGFCPPGVVAPPIPDPGRLAGANLRPRPNPTFNRGNQPAMAPMARLPLQPHTLLPPPPVLRVQPPMTSRDPMAVHDPMIAPNPMAARDPMVAPNPMAARDPMIAPNPMAAPDPMVAPDPRLAPNQRGWREPMARHNPRAHPDPMSAPVPMGVPVPMAAPFLPPAVNLQPHVGGAVPGARGDVAPPPPEAFRGRTFEAPAEKGRPEHGHPEVNGERRSPSSTREAPPSASGGASAKQGKGS
jgi:hypothetical protein